MPTREVRIWRCDMPVRSMSGTRLAVSIGGRCSAMAGGWVRDLCKGLSYNALVQVGKVRGGG